MRASLVLTVIADDKPGIVERLAEQILAAGANWEQGRMARLAGGAAGGELRVGELLDDHGLLAEIAAVLQLAMDGGARG